MSDGPRSGQLRFLRRPAFWFVVVLCAATYGSWTLGRRVDSPAAQLASSQPPPPTVLTAAVEHRALKVSLTGTAEAAAVASQMIPVALPSGDVDAVVTSTPVSRNERIAVGRILIEVSGEPTFYMLGRFPAYRDLRRGDLGPDVVQARSALQLLGYSAEDQESAEYGPGLARALKAFLIDRGYEQSGKHLSKNLFSYGTLASPYLTRRPLRVGDVLSEPLKVTVAGRSQDLTATLLLGGSQVGPEVGNRGKLQGGKKAPTVTVTSVGDQDQDSQGRTVVKVGLSPPDSFTAVAGRAYEVSVSVDASGGKQLVVPSTAVWSPAAGREVLTLVESGHRVRDIPVRVLTEVEGASAVEAAGGGELEPGDLVALGESSSSGQGD